MFYFKCAINVNDYCKVTCRKTKMLTIIKRFLPKFLYKITTRKTKGFLLHKNLKKKGKSKYLLLLRFKPNVGRTAYIEKKVDCL